MKISYKIDKGIGRMWHAHPAFAPVPADDDDLVQQIAQNSEALLDENVDAADVSKFWGNVVDDLRSKGELNDYHDEVTEEYKEDPAYK
jgi:hypothetical protein